MTIQLQPLSDLDPALIEQNLAELLVRVQEDNPHLDLKRGVFAELLAYYNALLGAQRQANINDYLDARSLKVITETPALADPDLVDDVLSNFRLERKDGSKATGEVTVVVETSITVTIASGSLWSSGGKNFLATQVYTGKIDEDQINGPGDRLMTETAEGNYAFTITVEAEEEGPDSEVKKDAAVVPANEPVGYITSYAAGDFTGGLAQETNQELIERLQQGIACRAPSNRVNMSAMLRNIEAFARTVGMSIVGYGDPEMHRDRHWIFPVSGGGRIDWYVRTQEQVYRTKLVKEATLIEVASDGFGIWQFTLGRNEAPGFYEITNVRPLDTVNATGGYTVTDDVRGVDLTGTGFIPDIDAESAEGMYSRFQTATIQFKDTDTVTTSLGLLSKQTYEVEARCLPLIADIQDTVSARDVRSCGADVLVKAPVPCFLQLSFTINKRATDADPDLAAIKDALCSVVNNTGFIGLLYASTLQDAIRPHLGSAQAASAIDMFGRIRYPGGTIRYLRDTELLSVPDEPADLVTARTVQFFVTADDIAISVATTVPSV